MLLADGAQAPVVDFYAGAIAFFAVTMFARFVIHKTKTRRPEREWLAQLGHWVSVVWSAVGIVAALIVLGFGDKNPMWPLFEGFLRFGAVGLGVIVAAVIFAVDVATTPPHRQRSPQRQARTDPNRSGHQWGR
jgi:hypothetical protein